MDLLPFTERRPRVLETRAVRKRQCRVELEQRHDHEAAGANLRMGQRQPFRLVLDRFEQQHVDVDWPGTVPGAAGLATELLLELLTGAEQLFRAMVGADPQAGVQKIPLIENKAHRLCLVDRRGRQNLHSVSGQRRHCLLKVRATLTDVRTEPQIADPAVHERRGLSLAPDLDGHLAHRQWERRLRLGRFHPNGAGGVALQKALGDCRTQTL